LSYYKTSFRLTNKTTPAKKTEFAKIKKKQNPNLKKNYMGIILICENSYLKLNKSIVENNRLIFNFLDNQEFNLYITYYIALV